MPIVSNFTLPGSAKQLAFPNQPNSKLFIAFISSDDPTTKQSWCPDVRAALPVLKAAFSAEDAPELAFVEVGQRPEWRVPTNKFRVDWDVHYVPTLVRYEYVEGEVREVGRLVEVDVQDEKKVKALVSQ